MPPSDSLIPLDGNSGSPCHSLPWGERFFFTESRLRSLTHARRRVVTGSPSHRNRSGRNEGLPGSWIILFVRAPVVHPAGCSAALPYPGDDAVVFRDSEPFDIQNTPLFEAATLRPIRSPAYASPWRVPALAQGWLPTCRAQLWLGGVCTHWTMNWLSKS